MLHNKRILLGITGSIAAYKSALLARELQRRGAEVRVVMSKAATEFITPVDPRHPHRPPGLQRLYRKQRFKAPGPTTWNSACGLTPFLIAPATAQTLSSMVQGAGDSFLLAVHLSSRCPVVVAPAMDLDMFTHPATQENLKTLRIVAWASSNPNPDHWPRDSKAKAAWPNRNTSQTGWNRGLQPPPLCTEKRSSSLPGQRTNPLTPFASLATAVRAKWVTPWPTAFIRLGAEVTLVSGPVQLSAPEGVHDMVKVQTAQEMYDAAVQRFPTADIAVAAAAVADARPKLHLQTKSSTRMNSRRPLNWNPHGTSSPPGVTAKPPTKPLSVSPWKRTRVRPAPSPNWSARRPTSSF